MDTHRYSSLIMSLLLGPIYLSWALLLHTRFFLPYCMVRRQDLHNRETNRDHYSYLLPCMSQQWLSTHHQEYWMQYCTVSWLAVAFFNFQWFLSWLLCKWRGKLSVTYQLEFRKKLADWMLKLSSRPGLKDYSDVELLQKAWEKVTCITSGRHEGRHVPIKGRHEGGSARSLWITNLDWSALNLPNNELYWFKSSVNVFS